MNTKVIQFSLCLFLGATVTACASQASRPLAERAIASIALADSALEIAELSGAREYAPVQLRTAHEKKTAADKAIYASKYRQAQLLGAEAHADARLAQAATEVAKAQQKLAQEQDKIEVLQPVVLVPVKESLMGEEQP